MLELHVDREHLERFLALDARAWLRGKLMANLALREPTVPARMRAVAARMKGLKAALPTTSTAR